jgi:hypothetical protein
LRYLVAGLVLVIVAAAAFGLMFYASYVVLRAKAELPRLEEFLDDQDRTYSAPLRPQPR